MKLSIKLAGLFGSGVFVLTAVPGFFQQVKPSDINAMMSDAPQGMNILESLGFSLLGAVVAGVIGYIMGDILSSPRGNAGSRKRPGLKSSGSKNKPGRLVTGNETFLDDLEAPVKMDSVESAAHDSSPPQESETSGT
jgi:hypothetical protein